ncbi:hypothetical protein [Urbifossiella limnaea]|uniref:hypothetical protein n=1 Tax=Urbifossiella limnaea TaxID=2528023 RepID=UPI0011AA8865|nr:hypothetical protein [Urbifossiella limnaea]
MPPELSAWIAARIASYPAEATEPYHHWEAAAVGEFAALPLIRHWFETFGLRADGEVVRWSTDGDAPYPGTQPVEGRCDWLSALVEGARRWPELAALLPARPPAAVACRCVGHPAFEPGKFLCPECCGLRWVAADAEPVAAADGRA